MNDYGIRIVGVGWLKYYDPDAGGGVGMISATTDPAEALRFPDKASAWACWQQQSTVRPLTRGFCRDIFIPVTIILGFFPGPVPFDKTKEIRSVTLVRLG